MTAFVPRSAGGWLLAVAAVCVCLATSETARAAEGGKPKTRWAIVAADAKANNLADLLTVELSRWDNVELLERDRIRNVLAELQLNASGLVTAERVTRFGRLAQADALALIDVPQEEGENKVDAVRLRLVDTRTSVRLLDVLLPQANLEADVAALRDELKSTSATLEIPAVKLRLIGLVPITSGEPGEFLKPYCRTLTTLVEVGLHQHPQFVVVERSELQRLTAEADLTGLQLELRASSQLLEASIRRADDGAGMLATCRLISRAGKTRDFNVTVASGELVDMRQEIIAAISRALGDGAGTRPLSLAAEAKVFDRRVVQFDNLYKRKDAAEMAEAALALSPSPERLVAVFNHCGATDEKNKNPREGLEAAVRYQSLRVAWWAKTRRGDPMRSAIPARQVYLNRVTIPWGRFLTPGDQPLIDELYALSNQFFDQQYSEAEDDTRRLQLLQQRLDYLVRLTTPQEYSAAVSAVVGQMQSIIDAAAIPKDTADLDYVRYTRLLMAAEDANTTGIRLGGRSGRLNAFENLALRLGSDEEPGVQIAKMYGRAMYTKDPDTALRLLTRLDEWPPAAPGPAVAEVAKTSGIPRPPSELLASSATGKEVLHVRAYFYAIRKELLKRHPEILAPYLDRWLTRTEEAQDATQLLQLSSLFPGLLIRGDQAHDLAARILAAIDNLPHSANASHVAVLRSFARYHFRPERHPVYSYENRQGGWRQYTRVPIRLENVRGRVALRAVVPDPHAGPQPGGAPLVLVWQKEGTLLIERVGMSGGTPEKLCPEIPVRVVSVHGLPVAVGPDMVFLPSPAGGFWMVKNGKYEIFTEKEGAPSNDVFSVAWLKDRLYIGFRDALASFDPQTKTFRLLASGTSVEPRNPMDGLGSFFITSMIADEAHDCVWLNVQDNATHHPRTGVWRFRPAADAYEKITQRVVDFTPTDGGLLLYRYDSYLGLLNTETAELTELTHGLRVSTSIWRGPPPILIGEHLITRTGTLHTPAGKDEAEVAKTSETARSASEPSASPASVPGGEVSRLEPEGQWKLLQRVGPGFITHYDDKSQTLWYFQPNP